MIKLTPEQRQRFDMQTKTLDSGCKVFQSLSDDGKFHFAGNAVNPARVAYILEHGELSGNETVIRTCGTANCINGDCLEAVPTAELERQQFQAKQNDIKPASPGKELKHSEEVVLEVREAWNAGLTVPEIVELMDDIDYTNVSNILTSEAYAKHFKQPGWTAVESVARALPRKPDAIEEFKQNLSNKVKSRMKFTPEQINEVRARILKGEESYEDIAKDFVASDGTQMSSQQVSKIGSGARWSDLPMPDGKKWKPVDRSQKSGQVRPKTYKKVKKAPVKPTTVPTVAPTAPDNSALLKENEQLKAQVKELEAKLARANEFIANQAINGA